MSTPSPLQYSKSKSKRRSKGPADSPKALKYGHQWVPLPSHSAECMVPAHKISAYQHLEGTVLESPLFAERNGNLRSLPGGVIIGSGRSKLYALWTPLEKLDISEYLPVRADSVLLHPETMRACGCVIASPVLVKGGGQDGAAVCGKAWPLLSLPLDVVGLGWGTLLGCHAREGEHVEVCAVPIPTSQVPIAGEVTLVPSEKLGFQVDSTFTQYLLHMHDGSLVTSSSYLGVQYLGERRVFKVMEIGEYLDRPQADIKVEELQQGLSELILEGSDVAQSDSSPMECGVYKITVRSKFKVISEDGGSGGSSGSSQPLSFSEIGGLKRQIQLLKELVLHPLTTVSNKGVQFPRGVILHGPSGVGKSLLAQVLACEAAPAHCVQLPASQLLTQEPENMFQKVFSEARENSPSLIVLDDLDAICPHGNSNSGELERRAVGCLLTQLDDLHRHPPPSHVAVLATTNQIDRVAPHLRRQGRFDKEIEIPVPSSQERVEILEVLLRSRSHSLSQEQLKSLAERAHGYVGADLCSTCSEAQYKALHRVLERGGVEGGGTMEERLGRRDGERLERGGVVGDERGREGADGEIAKLERREGEKLERGGVVGDEQGREGVDGEIAKLEGREGEGPERGTEEELKGRGVEGRNGDKVNLASGEKNPEGVRISMEDMLAALREVRPSAMKEVTLEVPKVLWSDIGGQEEVKRSMKEAVERPITHPQAYAKMGIRPPRGVLLYGPPGCSKTMVARALATESGLNFMAVKGPELFSKWVGDSERAVRQIFSRARAAAPAIIFFDEIDALAVQRKNEGSSVADRVLAQLLTEMDGVEALEDVLVVAATNRPDMIDKALIRPGRIDELIYVPLPCVATRREIFKIQFRKIPVGEEVVIEELVQRTKGFSGAEVVSVCQKAALCALREDVDCSSVGLRHFDEALKTVSPQTSPETVQYYQNFKTKQTNLFNPQKLDHY